MTRAPRSIRWLRRLAVAVVALALLWLTWGEPRRGRPRYTAEWLLADGVRTRALRAGQGDTTLIFLHGYGESLLAWRLILDRFTARYHVLALDLPGFGVADKPAGPYDYPRYLRWLTALATRYTQGPVVVVGHSMGGQLAAGLALELPDRVVAAVLLSPAGAGLSPRFSDSLGNAALSTHWVASAIPYLLPVHDPGWMQESAEAAGYEPSSDSAAALAALGVLQQFDFGALRQRLSQLRQPVLLLWGRHDPTIPFEIGERMAAELPCRRFIPLNTLHRPHQTVPDTVAAEMLSFLSHPGCQVKP